MSVTAQRDRTLYRVTTDEEIKTSLTIGGQRVWLVAGKDGLVRQIKGNVADPIIDEAVANKLRGDRNWKVGTWPAGYEPEEQVIQLDAAMMPPAAETGEDFAREGMYSQFKFIGKKRQAPRLHPDAQVEARPGRDEPSPPATSAEEVEARRAASIRDDDWIEPDLGDQERISELMAEVTALTGTVARLEAELAAMTARCDALQAKLDQAGRTHSPALPPPGVGPDGVERVAATAETLGKGPNMNPKRRGGSKAASGEPEVPAVPEALAGVRRG